MRRVKLRIRLTEKGPVAEPDIGELGVTDRRANRVEVAGRARGVDEWEKLATCLHARLGNRFVGADERLLLQRIVEHGVDFVESIDLRVAEAVDRRAPADAALVETNDVKSRVQAGEVNGALAQEVDTGLAGT